MTTTQDLQAEFAEAWTNLEEAKRKMLELCRRIGPERVEDYELQGREGGVRLSEMFGDKSDLILVHNMGSECPYCTMWADGFNGALRHLQDRAAFVAVSPNSVDVQQAVREKRGWQFEMYSAEGTTFIKDMGFESDGVALQLDRDAGSIDIPQERGRLDRSHREGLLRPGRPVLRSVAPVRLAGGRRGRVGGQARLPGASIDPATIPLIEMPARVSSR